MVGYFLGEWPVVDGAFSAVGATVLGGWSVGGGFVLCQIKGSCFLRHSQKLDPCLSDIDNPDSASCYIC